MSDLVLDDRVRLSIELALTADSADLQRRRQQEQTARTLGMTGAEIDIARRGSSFDALTSFAVALAMASHGADKALVASARERALAAGLSADVCERIIAYAGESSAART